MSKFYNRDNGLETDLEVLGCDGEAYLSFDEIIKWLKWQQSLLDNDPEGTELMHHLIREMVRSKQSSIKIINEQP